MTKKFKRTTSSASVGNRPKGKQILNQSPANIPFYQDSRFLYGLIIFLTCLSFFPVLKNSFIPTWDDNAYVTDNPIIRHLNLQSLRLMFTKQVNGTYVPIPLLTYTIEFNLFGLHAFPFHFINLIIHIISTLLVFKLFRLLKINALYAAAGALLFGIHPMRIESVAWISERKDVLYTVFYLAALIYHVKFIKAGEKGTNYYRLTLLFFFLALLSKIEAVTLPICMLLIDYFMERPLKSKLLIEKIPHFILSFLIGSLGIFILSRVGLFSTNTQLCFLDRLFYGIFTLNIYIVKFFIPYLQSAIYPYPVAPGNSLPFFYYLSPVITVAIGFFVYKTMRFTKAVVFGVLFFFVNVVFLLQIVAAGSAFLSDRYTYLAYTGLIFITVWWIEYLVRLKNFNGRLVVFVFAIYCVILLSITFERCKTWKNGETLWTDVIKKFPDQNFAPYSNRGIAYSTAGQWDNALDDFSKAISLNSKFPVPYANRGAVYANIGQTDNAIADFTKALELDPNYKWVLHNRGVALGNIGQYDKAISDLSRAIKLDPKYLSAYINLNIIYSQKNRIDSAIWVCINGLRMIPESDQLHAALGNGYLGKQDMVNAAEQYRICLGINDRNLEALLGMAVTSFLGNEVAYAKGYLSQAQSVEPVLNEGLSGVEKLEKAGYSFTSVEKEVLAKLYSEMK